ncbi:SUMF1/EgtB/PvdO family nonheme iron enzyme [Methylomonas sp. CM2]|uniref:SUMF1/EgtB/PvdO family nonheme iron enzyme n=1 Tax=Methylomonas sp. CM2 TaxID=3417647 RepID=UPI003CF76F8E
MRWVWLVWVGWLIAGSAWAENYDALRAGIVKVTTTDGRIGTGFVVQIDGNNAYVVTASHVVEGEQNPALTLYQRQNDPLRGQVIHLEGGDPRGLALVKINGNLPSGLVALPLAADNVRPDESIVLIGFPLGGGAWMPVVGQVGTPNNKDMTMSAIIEEGNSGGPVLYNRQVAGVVMKQSGEKTFGKAVPISIVKTTLENWGVVVGSSAHLPVTMPATSPEPCRLCPDMVNIPAGDFWMGSADNEPNADKDEKPRHKVHVDAFRLAKYEVSRAEFEAFVEATGHVSGECGIWDGKQLVIKAGSSWRNPPSFEQSGDHPVVCVSHDDAQAYIRWLNQQTGFTYRLPTEAEWEYAARAGASTTYPWGNAVDDACRFGNVADQAARQTFKDWTIANCRDGYVYTAPRGQFLPNGFGLYDISGNVWEWTCSAYNTKNGYDGSEKRCSSAGLRAIRGGSWDNGPVDLRSAYRGGYNPVNRDFNLGFRLAQD